ncbi:MAG: hypothetical protein ACKOKG_10700 [Verrucomicrobiota bacterium]
MDLLRLKVRPLAERRSLTRVEDILIDPIAAPAELSAAQADTVGAMVEAICSARKAGAPVILMYGAHLIRNGAVPLLTGLMEAGFIQHLATNGAGTIHDWEYAWLGKSTEGVEENVAAGTFGAWDETGRNIHLALMAGALQGLGYGQSLGKFIHEDGCELPDPEMLAQVVGQFPADPMAGACCELLSAMSRHGLAAGRHAVTHGWKHASLLAQAWRLGVPVTVHPGIGYDIISCHPMFNGAVIGRAAALDFRTFAGAVESLDGGVVLSIGSAIMAPQVFEKSLSCAHNLRLQQGRGPVSGHHIYVVDLQDGGGWDWTKGEPPKTNPAYYLRFCKSFSRMGGSMQYLQCDNATLVHHLHRALVGSAAGAKPTAPSVPATA